MTKTVRGIFLGALVAAILFATSAPSFALDFDKLSASDIKKAQNLINKLAPLIEERDKKQNLATLTFDELYAPLSAKERRFLKKFQSLDAKKLNVKIPFRGIATGKEELVVIKNQKIKTKEGKDKYLSPQFLPPNVYEQYLVMMKAMKKDLKKQLYIESGYRSSAYQVYLFVYYLRNHEYSIRETVKFVALPGFSEHGSVKHQAIDFINENNINGEDDPKEFEDLPEYKWLLEHAKEFNFVLSYPKNAGKGITFEPWHWRYEKQESR
ncbi:MAG: M15 family metallopeptidase [Candidatus Omnitrophota bacterium]